MRPSLCSCQCIAVERESSFCMRYMPTFRVPGLRVVRDDRREGDERRGVAGPAVLDRQEVEIHVVAFEHDVVVGRTANGLRPRVGDRLQRLQAADLLGQALRRLHLEHRAELGGRVVEAVHPEREAHAPLGAELVDEQRVLASPSGFSKRSAGPPERTVRSTISVTSRYGSTSAATRTSSPSRSRRAIHSRRSAGGLIAVSLGL